MEIRLTLYILIIAAWAAAHIRTLVRRRKKREAAACAAILTFACVIGSFLIARIDIPSPVVPFRIWIEPIGRRLLE